MLVDELDWTSAITSILVLNKTLPTMIFMLTMLKHLIRLFDVHVLRIAVKVIRMLRKKVRYNVCWMENGLFIILLTYSI